MPAEDTEAELSAFIETAVRSTLLERPALTEALTQLPSDKWSAARLAELLTRSGQLTAFQSEKLLAGLSNGLVIGPYQLLFPIGRGAVGIVYLAKDTRLKPGSSANRLVALKLLPPKRAREEPRVLARFQHEMEIGSQLPQHPFLIHTLDSGQRGGVHYLAMQYAGGPTAKQLVVEGGPLPVPNAARVFADVAVGLHAAHGAGFVHRDVKPSNVIVSDAGRGKVLDFGFAVRRGQKPHDDPTILGGLGYTLGTMDFLPPEQAQNAVAVSAETDIYSLGCSLYFVVTGRVPFPDGTAQEKLKQHRTKEPESVDKLNPAVPDQFARLIRWMMAKRPEDRPRGMDQVAEELEHWATRVKDETTLTDLSHWEKKTLQAVETRWRAHKTTAGEIAAGEDLIILEDTSTQITLPTATAEPTRTPSKKKSKKPKRKKSPDPKPFPWVWVAVAVVVLLVLCVGCSIPALGLLLWSR